MDRNILAAFHVKRQLQPANGRRYGLQLLLAEHGEKFLEAAPVGEALDLDIAFKQWRYPAPSKNQVAVKNGSQTLRVTAQAGVLGIDLDIHRLNGPALQKRSSFSPHCTATHPAFRIVQRNAILIEYQIPIQVGERREQIAAAQRCIRQMRLSGEGPCLYRAAQLDTHVHGAAGLEFGVLRGNQSKIDLSVNIEIQRGMLSKADRPCQAHLRRLARQRHSSERQPVRIEFKRERFCRAKTRVAYPDFSAFDAAVALQPVLIRYLPGQIRVSSRDNRSIGKPGDSLQRVLSEAGMRLEWISAGGGIDLSRKAHVARGVQSDVELRAAGRKLHPGLRERFPVYRKILERCIAAYVGPAHGSIALKIRLPDGSLNRVG